MRIAPADALELRLKRLRELLARQELDALVITGLPNVAYLTGFFSTAAALMITPAAPVLLSDGRYGEALAARRRDWQTLEVVMVDVGASYDQKLLDIFDSVRGLRVGIEAPHLSVSRYRYLTNELGRRGWANTLKETNGLVEQLRVQKDDWEVGRLREGARHLSDVAKSVLRKNLAGHTESEIAAEIDSLLRGVGFERPAFDTIVAAGPNAALPHGRAGRRTIEKDDVVVLDFGGVLDGYCTDLTRTVAGSVGHSRARRLIEQVADAQQAAFETIRPTVAPEIVDTAARERLTNYGLADAFNHGTGHGLGLEIHEAPRLTRPRAEHPEPPLAAGMVMTLEPGVYFPGWGGVRIEDDVLVTKDGAEWLTDVPRML
jgi:Xaa-Pro aminopeptidase